jgi:hypothetical protein
VPVPVPANYLRGIDVQKYDFEKGKWSYLRGEQKMGGWWYYYLYAMGVKMPAGTLFLLAITCVVKATSAARGLRRVAWGKTLAFAGWAVPTVDLVSTSGSRPNPVSKAHPTHLRQQASGTRDQVTEKRSENPTDPLSPTPALRHSLSPSLSISLFDELILLAPALLLITLVSSQTGFNRYLRYVVPAFPFLYIWISQLAAQGSGIKRQGSGDTPPTTTKDAHPHDAHSPP